MELDGKVAVVTGAASGIGKATALLFAEHGASVVVADLNVEVGEATASMIRDHGGRAIFSETDISISVGAESVAKDSIKEFGKIDVLVNSAGISGRAVGDGPAHECTEFAWDLVLSTNLKGTYLSSKFVLPYMLEAGSGSIVNISSALGLVGGGEDFAIHAYIASKGGIISLTRGMASYYASRGVRVNAICPGLINTAMTRPLQETKLSIPKIHPLTGKRGEPYDIAAAALFFAGDEASFVTGAILAVDAGWSAQ